MFNLKSRLSHDMKLVIIRIIEPSGTWFPCMNTFTFALWCNKTGENLSETCHRNSFVFASAGQSTPSIPRSTMWVNQTSIVVCVVSHEFVGWWASDQSPAGATGIVQSGIRMISQPLILTLLSGWVNLIVLSTWSWSWSSIIKIGYHSRLALDAGTAG